MIFLDTHAILWLHEEEFDKFSESTLSLIRENDLYYSTISRVEIHSLNQRGKITKPAIRLLHDMENRIGILKSPYSIDELTYNALTISWTRDPFDLLISAEVHSKKKHTLITRDRTILKNLKEAIW